jgi:3-methylfumaryl-CoA hydratase
VTAVLADGQRVHVFVEHAIGSLANPDWIGRSETLHDTIGPTPVRVALTATLDHPATRRCPGTPLPPLWHWLYFLPMHRQSEIGPDGHAKRGGFLPPVPLPRRMWAGSQFEFRAPVRVGDARERTSTIDDVTVKEGRTGRWCS